MSARGVLPVQEDRMQATGIILLLAAGVIVLFGQDGSFVHVEEPAQADFEIELIAKDTSDTGV